MLFEYVVVGWWDSPLPCCCCKLSFDDEYWLYCLSCISFDNALSNFTRVPILGLSASTNWSDEYEHSWSNVFTFSLLSLSPREESPTRSNHAWSPFPGLWEPDTSYCCELGVSDSIRSASMKRRNRIRVPTWVTPLFKRGKVYQRANTGLWEKH